MNENIFAIYDKKSGEHFGLCVWPNAELLSVAWLLRSTIKIPAIFSPLILLILSFMLLVIWI